MRSYLLILFYLLPLNAFSGLSLEQRKALFRDANQRLKEAKLESKVPKVGEIFPDLNLSGKKVSDYLKDGPLVVTFYRGGWCPYCVKQLKEINASIKLIKDRGAHLVALSPEKAKEVEETKRKNSLDFTLTSDNGNAIARQLNLTFKVEPQVVQEYKALGIDLAASQGNESYELPMPATFVIGKNRKIAYVFADSDYAKRASTEEILATVKRLQEYTDPK